MKRIAKVEIWLADDGWLVRLAVDGEPVRDTRGWRSLLTALDQVGKVIAQRVAR